MQPKFKFKIGQMDIEYNLVEGQGDTHKIVWFESGRHREASVSEQQVKYALELGNWQVTWSKEKEEEEIKMNHEVKNCYFITIHNFLQKVRQDGFFFDSSPSLDSLTVCLGQDAEFEKKLKRLIEEHLRDEEGYRDVVRGV